MTDKLPKQQYVDIQPIPFHNDDPINWSAWEHRQNNLNYNPKPHFIPFYTKLQKQTHQFHLTCWYTLSKTGDGEWLILMIGYWILWCSDDENEIQLKT